MEPSCSETSVPVKPVVLPVPRILKNILHRYSNLQTAPHKALLISVFSALLYLQQKSHTVDYRVGIFIRKLCLGFLFYDKILVAIFVKYLSTLEKFITVSKEFAKSLFLNSFHNFLTSFPVVKVAYRSIKIIYQQQRAPHKRKLRIFNGNLNWKAKEIQKKLFKFA